MRPFAPSRSLPAVAAAVLVACGGSADDQLIQPSPDGRASEDTATEAASSRVAGD